ncbi:hypothetical protein JCM10908_006506 [Rhodotorula pacifica]|uniref:uncharacterized protein n=1 Tax=Rhodotorula pacifica TaxID=1495444 RepID=UPI003170A2EA
MYSALRPLIWRKVVIAGEAAAGFVETLGRDSLCAGFIKELECFAISQDSLGKLWPTVPQLVSLSYLYIGGPHPATLQLFMLERLPALTHLHLRYISMDKRLPKLIRLESLCLEGIVHVHRPLGQDIPILADAILTQYSHASVKTLSLCSLSIGVWGGDVLRKEYCIAALNKVDVAELDATSFSGIRTGLTGDLNTIQSHLILKAYSHDISALLDSGCLVNDVPDKFSVWIKDDLDHDSELRSCVMRALSGLNERIREHSIKVASLTLPVHWGQFDSRLNMLDIRQQSYKLLQTAVTYSIPVRFHDDPPRDDYWSTSRRRNFERREGYFADLIKGQCTEPGLRDFKIVMVD